MKIQYHNDYGLQPNQKYCNHLQQSKKYSTNNQKLQKNLSRRNTNSSNWSQSSQKKGIRLSKHLTSNQQDKGKQNSYAQYFSNTFTNTNKIGRNNKAQNNKILKQKQKYNLVQRSWKNKNNQNLMIVQNSFRDNNISSNRLCLTNQLAQKFAPIGNFSQLTTRYYSTKKQFKRCKTQRFQNNLNESYSSLKNQYLRGSIIDILKFPSIKNNF